MQTIILTALLLTISSMAVAETANLLVYKVLEQGVEPYISRILVNADYVRLDEGDNQGAYTLFDRQQETIYNISHEDKSVLVIQPGQSDIHKNVALVLAANVTQDKDAPTVAGITPQHVQLLANGEVCTELVAVPGLLNTALEGLRELKQVLARVQAATLNTRPDALHTPCDLASNIHAPSRLLDYGLPIQEQSEGRAQALVDFSEQHQVDKGLFQLPEKYKHTAMPNLPII